jgi:hypothetical protein
VKLSHALEKMVARLTGMDMNGWSPGVCGPPIRDVSYISEEEEGMLNELTTILAEHCIETVDDLQEAMEALLE